MAKLTDEQKAVNRVVRTALEARFRARRKEYEAAQAQATAAFEREPFKAQYAAADAQLCAAMAQRETERLALAAQIAALQDRIQGLDEKLNLEAIGAARREASTAYLQGRDAALRPVDVEFKDVVGIWSAAQWAANVDKAAAAA